MLKKFKVIGIYYKKISGNHIENESESESVYGVKLLNVIDKTK